MKKVSTNRGSTVNFKGRSIDVEAYYEGGVKWINLEDVLNLICLGDETLKTELSKLIPDKDKEVFYVDGEAKIFMDRLALTYIYEKCNDYDLYKYLVHNIKPMKNYAIDIFFDIFPTILGESNKYNSLNGKISGLGQLQQDILHKIEKYNLEDDELLELSKKLKEVREERRLYKNQLTRLKLSKDIADKCSINSGEFGSFKSKYQKDRQSQQSKLYNKRSTPEIMSKFGCKEILKEI